MVNDDDIRRGTTKTAVEFEWMTPPVRWGSVSVSRKKESLIGSHSANTAHEILRQTTHTQSDLLDHTTTLNSADKCNVFLKRCKRRAFSDKELPSITEIFDDTDNVVFARILKTVNMFCHAVSCLREKNPQCAWIETTAHRRLVHS